MSRYFATEAFPNGSGPDYVNATAVVRTNLSASEVLTALHEIEHEFDRARENRWAARTLDLDLIAAGDLIAPDPVEHARWRNLPAETQTQVAPDQLILPHPRLQDRAFVLVPMRDIAANWRHPVLDLTIAEMCDALTAEQRDEPRVV